MRQKVRQARRRPKRSASEPVTVAERAPERKPVVKSAGIRFGGTACSSR